MRKLAYIVFLFFISFAAYPQAMHAFMWGNKALVTINDQEYSPEDFEHWWENWKEGDAPFPENPETFVEWQLMAQEAGNMQLERTPGYKKKVDTFLKARSMILFRQEAILSKIQISKGEIKELYDNDYNPIWNISILYFKEKSDAEAALNDFVEGGKSFVDFPENNDLEEGAVNYIERMYRPKAIRMREVWKDIVPELEKGEISPIFQDGEWFIIIQIKEITIPDQADYEKFKELIKQEISKRKQEKLTIQLVEKLKKKYNVQVNDEILEKLGEEDFSEELLDEPLVTTSRSSLPTRIIAQQIENEEKLRTRKPLAAEKKKEFKQQLLDGLIGKVLLGWESLDQHYEESPPFKWSFDFYKKHRLNKALEKHLYSKMPQVNEEQIATYYDENVISFTKPEIVKIGTVKTDQKTAKKIWLATLKGEDFFNVVEKKFSLDVEIQEIPKKHLAPEIQEEMVRMVKDDVSSPVVVDDEAYIIKLIDRKEKQTVPLGQVKDGIREKLTKEKFVQIRAEFVQKLKEHSSISINQKQWEAIQKEHRGENEI